MLRRSKLVILPLLFAILSLYLFFVPSFAPQEKAAWYNTGYLYKKQLTIDHTKVGGLPVFDGRVANGWTLGTTISWSHTTTVNPNSIMIVNVSSVSKSVSSVTYNGVSFTKLTTLACSAGCNHEIWYLLNPASGVNTVVVTLSASDHFVASSTSYFNVNQTTPFGTLGTNTGTSSGPTVTFNTVTNELVYDLIATPGSFAFNSQGGGQTLLSDSCHTVCLGASYKSAGSSSTTMSWTMAGSSAWSEIAVPINTPDQTNFPVLISMTDANLKTVSNGGLVQNSNGYDIIFTDSSETTKLDHEIETYVASTGQIVMWVRISTLSATADTIIYMYYGNSSISTSQANSTGVWNANYKGVWHLGETSGNALDSTSNGSSGTINGTVSQGTSGVFGNAYSFNGSNGNYVSVTNPGDGHLDFGTNSFSFSGWIYMNNTPTTGTVYTWLYKGAPNAAQSGYNMTVNATPTSEAKVCDGTTNVIAGITAIAASQWNYLVAVVDKNSQRIYLYQNGVLQGSGSSISAVGNVTSSLPLTFAGNNSGLNVINGKIQEVRANNSALTPGWIATEYNNQSSPSTFETVGSLTEQIPNAPTSLLQYRNDGSTAISNGTWTSDGITNNIVFSFSMSSPEASDTLTPEIELELNGTSFTGTPNYSGSSVSYSGSAVTGTVTVTGLTNCSGYHWEAFVANSGGTGPPTVFNSTTPNFSVASSAPTASTVYDGSVNGSETSSTTSITSLNSNWASFADSCSGLPSNPYQVAIGSSSGGTDTLSYTSTGISTGSPNTFSNSSLSLTAGKTYYISVKATNNAGLSTIATSSGITVSPTISFSLSANNLSMPVSGNIIINSGTSNISNLVQLNVSTNASHGFAVTVQDSNGGMRSAASNHTIASVGSGPTTLASEGFGVGVYGVPSVGTIAGQYLASSERTGRITYNKSSNILVKYGSTNKQH